MRKANVRIKNRNGEYITYTGISKIILETDSEPQTFSMGEMVNKEINNFSFDQGNSYHVEADDTELFSGVTINKPANLKPENIAEGIEVAGIIGTFEGIKEKPQLMAPTLSRSGDTITIQYNNQNGKFIQKYAIFDNDEEKKEINASTWSQNYTFSIIGLNIRGHNYIKCVSRNIEFFTDSGFSNIIDVMVYGIDTDFEELSISDKPLITQNLTYTNTLAPLNNKALPEDIEILMGNEPCVFSYNSYNGEISIENVVGDISIHGFADDEFHLRRPGYILDFNELKIQAPRFAEHTYLYIDGVEVEEVTPEFKVEVIGQAGGYGFIENIDGSWTSNNKKISNSYAICQIIIRSNIPGSILINYNQYTEQNYDYAFISQPNVSLPRNADGATSASSTVLKTFYGVSTGASGYQTYDLPYDSGETIYEIKFRKDGSVDSGNDCFTFYIGE